VTSLALLAQTIEVWTGTHGYAFVDLPWRTRRSGNAPARGLRGREFPSRPGGRRTVAEDAFVQLWTAGNLPEAPGYIGWLPCIGDGPAADDLHHFGFVTAELFVPVADAEEGRRVLPGIICRQKLMLSSLAMQLGCPGAAFGLLYESDSQLNLLLNGIGVGTYGVRALPSRRWYACGIALALPRFCEAVIGVHEQRAPVGTASRGPERWSRRAWTAVAAG